MTLVERIKAMIKLLNVMYKFGQFRVFFSPCRCLLEDKLFLGAFASPNISAECQSFTLYLRREQTPCFTCSFISGHSLISYFTHVKTA